MGKAVVEQVLEPNQHGRRGCFVESRVFAARASACFLVGFLPKVGHASHGWVRVVVSTSLVKAITTIFPASMTQL